MVSVPLVEVTVRVPQGCERLMIKFADDICEEFPGGPDREAILRKATAAHDARVQRGLQAVYDVIAEYRGFPEPEKKMARDANSRARTWFVRFGNERWPLKALYYHVIQKLPQGDHPGPQQGYPSESRVYHTEQARQFMQGLGLTVQKGRD